MMECCSNKYSDQQDINNEINIQCHVCIWNRDIISSVIAVKEGQYNSSLSMYTARFTLKNPAPCYRIVIS